MGKRNLSDTSDLDITDNLITAKDSSLKTRQPLEDHKLVQYDMAAGKRYFTDMNFIETQRAFFRIEAYAYHHYLTNQEQG